MKIHIKAMKQKVIPKTWISMLWSRSNWPIMLNHYQRDVHHLSFYSAWCCKGSNYHKRSGYIFLPVVGLYFMSCFIPPFQEVGIWQSSHLALTEECLQCSHWFLNPGYITFVNIIVQMFSLLGLVCHDPSQLPKIDQSIDPSSDPKGLAPRAKMGSNAESDFAQQSGRASFKAISSKPEVHKHAWLDRK